MASLLIVGEEPCTIPKMVSIMSESFHFSDLRSNLQKFARILGLPEEVVVELEPKNELNVDQLQRSLFHLLLSWTENCGNRNTMEHLCRALGDCDAGTIADKLKEELTKELNTRFGGVYEPASMKISDIFRSPPGNNRLGKKDPVQILSNWEMAVRLVSADDLPRIVGDLVDQLNKYELNDMEQLVIRRLSVDEIVCVPRCYIDDEENGEKLFRAMNLTNWGRNYVAWFVAARVMDMNDWPMQGITDYVFEIEMRTCKRGEEERGVTFTPFQQKSYRFKRKLLVYFMDWWVGTGYEFPFDLRSPRLCEYAIACFNSKLVNLTNRIFRLPDVLHGLVGRPYDFDPRKFVHLAAKHIHVDQFLQFVRYLVHHRLTHLLNARDSNHRTPIFHAIRDECIPDLSTVQHLASAGVDLNATDRDGKNVLFDVVKRSASVELLRTLVEHGAEYTCTSSKKRGLLHKAAWTGNLEAVKFLISLGSDVNALDNDLKTPLIHAVAYFYKSFGDKIDVVKFLVEHGADVNAADNRGKTVLFHAVESHRSVGILHALVQRRAGWKCRTSNNPTLLHVAARKGNLEAAKYFVNDEIFLGCDVNARDNELNTPLISAVAEPGLVNIEVVKLLLEQGADVNAANKKRHTALYYAWRRMLRDVYVLLASNGATAVLPR